MEQLIPLTGCLVMMELLEILDYIQLQLGIIRYFIEKTDFEKYTVVVKERNLNTAKELYCDLDFVDFLVVGSDDSTQVNLQRIQTEFADSSVVMVGFFEHGI